MRFVRYQSSNDPLPRLGWLLEDRVGGVEGSPYTEFRRLEADRQLADVQLLAPVKPGKIIGVGRNYMRACPRTKCREPRSPIALPQAALLRDRTRQYHPPPPQSQQVVHEAELAVVIGKTGRWIQPDDAMDYVLGYTIGNDVTARDLQRRDGQWTRGKGFDTFCPLGPWIETEFDPSDALMTCHVSGEMRQMASTRDMLFNVRQLIAYISSIMTIEPGDVLMTGTPAGVGMLQPGDVVQITIEGLGTLQNPVTREKSW